MQQDLIETYNNIATGGEFLPLVCDESTQKKAFLHFIYVVPAYEITYDVEPHEITYFPENASVPHRYSVTGHIIIDTNLYCTDEGDFFFPVSVGQQAAGLLVTHIPGENEFRLNHICITSIHIHSLEPIAMVSFEARRITIECKHSGRIDSLSTPPLWKRRNK